MKKNQRITPANESMPIAYDTYSASTLEAEKRKPSMGFLYLFMALARRASEDKSVQELQNLSGLIEAEIQELQKDKSKLRVRDVLRKK
jgi:hypothetical protein